MKDQKLRSKILDCIKYIKAIKEFTVSRESVRSFSIDITSMTLSDLIENISKEDVRHSSIVFSSIWDEWGMHYTYADVLRKQTDEEYFSLLCDFIGDQRGYDKYKQYLELKKYYEGEQQ